MKILRTNKKIKYIFYIRAAILSSSIAMMLPGGWGNSVTVVELAQLPSGLAAWQSGSLGIYRVCGPVSKWLYSLPAYLAGIRISYPPSFETDVTSRHEWFVGKSFQKQHTKNCLFIYRLSRLLPILVTAIGGCLICEWSTRLFGAWPGVVSLGVWGWMAPVLAHGSLVTSDMASTVMMLLATRTFWGFLMRPSLCTMLASGVTLGFAQATKFTLLLLDPCWAVLLLSRAIQLSRSRDSIKLTINSSTRILSRRPLPSTIRFLSLGFGIFLISVIAIDVSYGFRGIGFVLSDWNSGHSSLAREVEEFSRVPAAQLLLRFPMPLPIELLRGLDTQLADTERVQSTYMLGQTRLGGWWFWYAFATLIKVPLPALILCMMSMVRTPAGVRGGEDLLWSGICILMPAGEVALVISATTGTGTNAAFRYLLPSLALLCVWVGLACHGHSRIRKKVIGVLLSWLFAAAIFATPDHLGWTNELGWIAERCTGKPPLIGDSLDWGQDLVRLGDWIAGHSEQGTTVACVYSLGIGEPFGLHGPAARSTLKGATFVAVSENILFGYDADICVSIDDDQSSLGLEQLNFLQTMTPFDRVGRTIRIYRYRDLPNILFGD